MRRSIFLSRDFPFSSLKCWAWIHLSTRQDLIFWQGPIRRGLTLVSDFERPLLKSEAAFDLSGTRIYAGHLAEPLFPKGLWCGDIGLLFSVSVPAGCAGAHLRIFVHKQRLRPIVCCAPHHADCDSKKAGGKKESKIGRRNVHDHFRAMMNL